MISRWDDDKGFGFIRPQAGGRKKSSCTFPTSAATAVPARATRCGYIEGAGKDGRPRADHARLAGLAIDTPAIRRNPAPAATRERVRSGREVAFPSAPKRSLGRALAVLAGAAGATRHRLAALAEGRLLHLVPAALSRLQRAGFPCPLLAGQTQRRTQRLAHPRTDRLHLLELLGGWPGAFLAQQVFRHKTRKLSFQLVFWGIVLLHQLFWIDWLSGGRLLGWVGALMGLGANPA